MPRKSAMLLHLLNLMLKPMAGRTSAPPNQLVALPQHPPAHDREAWRAYWKVEGQPWRTEPEVDKKRQEYLTLRRTILPDIKQGIYPFKGVKLNRADVEWLLATHENGRGPVDWNNFSQRNREGLDLRGASLSEEDLRSLPLARLRGGLDGDDWIHTTTEQRRMSAIHLEKSFLTFAHLEGSILTYAHLQGTSLNGTHLESADLFGANCESPVPATWRKVFFDESTQLGQIKMANDKYIGVRLLDVHWGNVNLTGIDWTSVQTLFYEHRARSKTTDDGKVKDRKKRTIDYQEAARAYHQLSIALQQQGINVESARFAFRGQMMQRHVLWFQMIQRDAKRWQRTQALGAWLFSWFLFLLAGYGFKPERSFLAYLFVIVGFATAYYLLGVTDVGLHHLAWYEAIVVSMTSFHGRGFFADQFHPGDPQALVAAFEALVGLIIEVTFIATLTQRFFNR